MNSLSATLRCPLRSVLSCASWSHHSTPRKKVRNHQNNCIICIHTTVLHFSKQTFISIAEQSYKIVSMSRPPAFLSENFAGRSNVSLSAFAKPTTAKYVTRPLSNLHITVVKQMESVLLLPNESPTSVSSAIETAVTLAGYGQVNVKRRVHGYKKLSLINRRELSRSELGECLFSSFDFLLYRT